MLRIFVGIFCIGVVIVCRWKINQEAVSQGMGSNWWGWIEPVQFPGRTLVLIVMSVALLTAFVCVLSLFFGKAPPKKS